MKDPKSILVVTLSNIGDVVMTTPVIMALVGKFPAARITVVVGPKAKPAIEKSPHIHRIVVYDKKADLMGKWRFFLELWKDRYDWAVDLRNTAIPFLVCAPKRSPLFRKFTKTNMRERHLEVLGMMSGTGSASSQKGDRHLSLGNGNEARIGKGSGNVAVAEQRNGLRDRNLRPGKSEKGIDRVCQPNSFQFFSKDDEAACFAKLKGCGVDQASGWILVAPGAASERKRWAADHFRETARELSAKTGKQILLIGSKEERPIAEAVMEKLPIPVRNLCGDMTLSETAFLISRASLLIANDSAIMHLGFEIGTPTVGLFGPTDHEKYGHEGPNFRIAREDAAACGCNSGRLPYAERSCFHGLGVARALALCAELLRENADSH